MGNIPKRVHYCWFGKSEKTELVNSCILSWKEKLKEYEIIEWNESNFPIDNINNEFVKKAYENENWAFVSDYVRLWVLEREGGIYFDTDVEVLNNIDSLLNNDCFIGFEDDITLGSCVIGAKSNHNFIKELLMQYSFLEYKSKMLPNVRMITDLARKYGLELNGEEQELAQNIKVYSSDYFSPKVYYTNELNITSNTVCIHHFNGSWVKHKSNMKNNFKLITIKIVGVKNFNKIILIKRNLGKVLNR